MGTPRLSEPVDQMRNVQRTASRGQAAHHDVCGRTRCRSNEAKFGAIALRVAMQVALNSEAGALFASGGETGAAFLEVAQHVLFAQQPGLHAF